MPGVGQGLLPNPNFSTANPYWWDPRYTWTFLSHEYRPRPSARDFLYATTWEIWRPDWLMANFVRVAVQRTVKINWYVGIAKQVRIILATQKEKQRNA